MTRLASIIAGLVAVAMLLGSPGCVSGPAFAPSAGMLRGASNALRKLPGGRGESYSDRLHGQLSLARLSERGGEYDQAKNLYARYLVQKPDDPLPYHRLAVIAARERQYHKAEEYFQKARSMAPPSSELLSDLGYFYYLQNRFSDAEELLRLAVEQDPEYVAASNNLGLLLGEQGRFTESFNAFQRAVSPAEAHSNLAFVMAQVGEHLRALEHYSQALTLQEDLRPAAEAMVHLAEREKQIARGVADPTDRIEDDAVGESVANSPTPAEENAEPNRVAGRRVADPAVAALESSGSDDGNRPASDRITPPKDGPGRMQPSSGSPLTTTRETHESSPVAKANYTGEHTSVASPVTAASAWAPVPRRAIVRAEDRTSNRKPSSSSRLFRRLLEPKPAAGVRTPPVE